MSLSIILSEPPVKRERFNKVKGPMELKKEEIDRLVEIALFDDTFLGGLKK